MQARGRGEDASSTGISSFKYLPTDEGEIESDDMRTARAEQKAVNDDA